MSRRMHDAYSRVPQLDRLAFPQRLERHRHNGRLVEAIRRAGPACKLEATGTMICMDVCVDHVSDPHVFRNRKGFRRLDILFSDVDGGAFTERSTPEDIARAPAFEVIEGSKDHCASAV